LQTRFVPLLLLLAACVPAHGQPRRIVSTAPSITETLFAIGAGPRVIGVTDYCHYPPETSRIPKIGTYLQPHTETILSLRPDLVITEDSPLHTEDQFNALGLKVLRLRFETVSDIYTSIEAMGRALKLEANAAALVSKIRSELAAVRSAVSGRASARTMFLVGRTPNVLEGMVAVGSAAYMNEVIEIAGGRNVFKDSALRYFRLSQEQIIARDPEVILDMGDMADTKRVTEAHKRSVLALWKSLPMLRAVRAGRVHPIASDIFVVPGPRVAECARQFASLFHPEKVR
jgi:iron complex transport system substrate-binding protein